MIVNYVISSVENTFSQKRVGKLRSETMLSCCNNASLANVHLTYMLSTTFYEYLRSHVLKIISH